MLDMESLREGVEIGMKTYDNGTYSSDIFRMVYRPQTTYDSKPTIDKKSAQLGFGTLAIDPPLAFEPGEPKMGELVTSLAAQPKRGFNDGDEKERPA